jgi:RepB plasmid partitioning protein/ParB-like nuclease domain
MGKVTFAFNTECLIVPVRNILPLRQIKSSIRSTHKYQQVLASVREVGIIEPLVVFPHRQQSETFLLLDGHIRLEVLKQLEASDTRCLVATDDESYTYNKRVNRMSTIQEHTMILQATKHGVSEERIAKVLKVNAGMIRQKRDLLKGICPEAAEILKNRLISVYAFVYLRKMNPIRQIEVTELLVAASNYSVPYVKALFAATPPEMLAEPEKHKVAKGLSAEQIAKMEKEMDGLQRDLKVVEESHGNQVLNLVLARGYLSKLFTNNRVSRYLDQNHPDIFRELKVMSEGISLDK